MKNLEPVGYISLFRRALSFDSHVAVLNSSPDGDSLRTDVRIGLLLKIYITPASNYLAFRSSYQSFVFPLLYVSFGLNENELQFGLK